MASTKSLNAKAKIVEEITKNVKNSESVVVFSYQGLTVADMSELRKSLRTVDSEVKIYKNTLVRRALKDLSIDMDDSFLEGPNAIVFGKELLEPIKRIKRLLGM